MPAANIAITAPATGDLSTTMLLRGAVGGLAGTAAAPKGQEQLWFAAGFFMGATMGQAGILAVLVAAMWKKIG